ncbi:chromatin modification- protein VID21, partial [Coemansia erecta]
MSRRALLDSERQQLLKEYFFWARISSKDIFKALEHSDTSTEPNAIPEIPGSKPQLDSFLDSYRKSPDRAIETLKGYCEKSWQSLARQESFRLSQSSAASKTIKSMESDMDVDESSQEGNFSSSTTEDEASDAVDDFSSFMHPDDVVFLSQLDPVGIAEVTGSYSVVNAEMLGNSMLHYNYQESIEEINSKSINMHNWLLYMQEQPLYDTVRGSSKLVSTKDWDCVREELIHMRVMERIEELKDKGKWSFWQPQKHRAPSRGKAHWDYLLDEAVWMHADFCEERKLRQALARMVSSWVMDYHHAVNKKLYTVNARKRILPDEFINRVQKDELHEDHGQTPSLEDITSNAMVVADKESETILDSNKRDTEGPQDQTSQTSITADVGLGSSDVSTNGSLQSFSIPADASADFESKASMADESARDSAVLPAANADDSAKGDIPSGTEMDDLVVSSSEHIALPAIDPSVEKISEPTVVPSEPLAELNTNSQSENTGEQDQAANPDLQSEIKKGSDLKAEPSDAPLAIANDEKPIAADISEDHVVPASNGTTENTLSVYHILAQLPQTDQMEVILGDSIYTLQSLNSLMPYGPAWDDAYCDVLDASPVVPICKTMWPDFSLDLASDDEVSYLYSGNYETTIDLHELVSFGNDDTSSKAAVDPDSNVTRSIFTRNFLAPPMLPMFTQANKAPRNIHSSTGQPQADTAIQQATSEACPGQVVFEWSPEKDKMLAKIIQQFTGNWPLITDTFNHAFSLYDSRAITPRICYERWVLLKEEISLDRSVVQTGFDDPEYGPRKTHSWSKQLLVRPSTTSLSAMQLATSIVSHSEMLKLVNESKTKRESTTKPSPVPPREIKPLAADQKVPTPAELSKSKFEHDRRIQQLFMEQRQATAAATASALAMHQHRALPPQIQNLQIARQIATLQAVLAGGRSIQRPLTPAQTQIIQQQLQNLQQMQLQIQAQMQAQAQIQAQMQAQGQPGTPLQRPPQLQHLQQLQQMQQMQQQSAQQQQQQQQQIQMQLAQAAQQQQQQQSQANAMKPAAVSGQQAAQSLPTSGMPTAAATTTAAAAAAALAAATGGINGAPGFRLTQEQIQQILQARAASNGA